MTQVLKFTKVQELIYELPIERVMKRDVIKVTPDTSMTELKEILRLNRISGVPVLDGERLAGVISIEDLIKALVQGDVQAPVKERMTTQLITVLESESVVEAVKKFAQYKVGRLLVVNEQGQLRGILTGGDITRGLLETISLDYHAEEISRYRAKHIFEDIISDRTSLILRYKVKAKDFKKAGSASSKLKRAMDRLGAVPEVIRRVAISAYEAEMNLIIHADEGGELTAELQPAVIRVRAIDHGPGIPNVDQAMSPGFSTAPNWIRELGFGAGMGLMNIKRCADSMRLESTLGKGTRLEIVVYLRQESGEQQNPDREQGTS
ncbi:MAG TPA: CBS domain-containing protein [Thermodesulfobacteriota bacterium]|nr:CBS domain-containing protein [Thermodesulfobacteriota bacterium]